MSKNIILRIKKELLLTKRAAVFSVVAALTLAASFETKAQVFSSTSINYGEYEINSAQPAKKMLQWHPNKNIIMDAGGFYLTDRGDNTLHYVNIPAPYNVLDFDILGDTLYFCGNATVSNVQKGYIAYIRVEDLFGGGVCNYSFLKTTTNVKKIKTYYNSDNERMIAGIGSHRYADPAYIGICLELDCPNNYVYPPAGNHDCLIVYKVNELQINANPLGLPFPPHYININHASLYNKRNDTITTEYFQDIAITDNYICLFSTRDTSFPALALRIFDKNNLTQLPNILSLASGANTAWPYTDFFVEHLGNDKVAIAYLVYTGYSYESIVTKVDLSTNPFTIKHSSLVSLRKAGIIDVEYVPETNQLLLLQEYDNPSSNLVYYVNMDDNVYSSQNSYRANCLNTNKRGCNSLYKLPSERDNYVVLGAFRGKDFGLLDKNIGNNTRGDFGCYSMDYQTITKYSSFIFIPHLNLDICSYGAMPGCYECALYIPQMYTSSIYAMEINTFRVPNPQDRQVKNSCLITN